jgi:hypothetical protein
MDALVKVPKHGVYPNDGGKGNRDVEAFSQVDGTPAHLPLLCRPDWRGGACPVTTPGLEPGSPLKRTITLWDRLSCRPDGGKEGGSTG